MHQKLVQNQFLILVSNQKQPVHASIYFKIRYIERGLSKSPEKVNFVFSFEPNPF